MRKLLHLAVCVCLAGAVAWRSSAATMPPANPDDGAVADGVFKSQYFNLSYPLPPGWIAGLAGPGPSVSGYYVLGSFVPAGELTATILIAAQDIFFAAKPVDDVMAMTGELGRAMAQVDGMKIDRPPLQVQIAGRRFGRVDFSGVGLFRSTLTTKIRCHFVSFNLTAGSPALLSTLALSLNRLGPADADETARVDPVCVGGYADAEHVLRKVDPAAIVPTFVPIPVRIVVGGDGSVEHVHVIRATRGQRDSIERALGQWKLKPPEIDGRRTEIETGLVIRFTPTGAVHYRPGNRTPPEAESE
jgi:hypothetical protein